MNEVIKNILGRRSVRKFTDFVFSDALRCWAPAFLTGMAFLGLQKIIDLLKERGE